MPIEQSRLGLIFALSAYITWGLAPIYFKFLSSVPAPEIIGHRIVWSVILLLAVLWVSRQLSQLVALYSKLPWLFLTALLVSGNWLIFVWAITHDRISETSLGYYINPLVSVFLARLFLKEQLRPLQAIAFILAASAVLLRLIHFGQLPWVALSLALSFGFYGLLRKHIRVPAVAGLAMETLILCPVALGYLVWLYWNDEIIFGSASISTNVLLIAAGFITTIPLLCFAAGVTRLSLTTMGILQYIAPSMSLIIAVLWYGELFTKVDFLSFVLIWLGLAVFTWDSFRVSILYRQSRVVPVAK